MANYRALRDEAHESHQARQRRWGGRMDSDEKQDRKEVASGVHKHERNMHRGEKETKLAAGGKVEGRAAGGSRLDRKGGKKGTTVNIILGGGQQQPPQVRPVPVPVRVPPPGAGGAMPPPGAGGLPPGVMPPRPPIAGMGPGVPPGGMPPGAMMPRKRGGSVKMTAGAHSGEGRLEKTRMVE
ncbi:MAG TPA: hypothetical protein VH024_17405 [Candidatus Angelobacter sp.]|jgi:hypothetical protein|nr:hypothetical protein [Candidatus Angelobacter sp.]